MRTMGYRLYPCPPENKTELACPVTQHFLWLGIVLFRRNTDSVAVGFVLSEGAWHAQVRIVAGLRRCRTAKK
jgi:hypothetical protein